MACGCQKGPELAYRFVRAQWRPGATGHVALGCSGFSAVAIGEGSEADRVIISHPTAGDVVVSAERPFIGELPDRVEFRSPYKDSGETFDPGVTPDDAHRLELDFYRGPVKALPTRRAPMRDELKTSELDTGDASVDDLSLLKEWPVYGRHEASLHVVNGPPSLGAGTRSVGFALFSVVKLGDDGAGDAAEMEVQIYPNPDEGDRVVLATGESDAVSRYFERSDWLRLYAIAGDDEGTSDEQLWVVLEAIDR